jgi:hypothetical protein
MDKRTLAVIERALQSDQTLFPLNASWQYLHGQYNIGRTQGNKLEVTAKDKAELATLVKCATGVDLTVTAVASFSGMQREQALAISQDEKWAGQAVKQSRLALKVLPGQSLQLNGHNYNLPLYSHCDIAVTDINEVGHDCVVVVENYRCFNRLPDLQFALPSRYAKPLVLYRGDNQYSEQVVRRWLAKVALPVLVMADIDPQGLVIAQSFSQAVGLLAPSLAAIKNLLQDRQKANPKLYHQQLASCQRALGASPHVIIQQLWALLQTYQAGVVQEHWLLPGYPLLLHSW